MRIKPSFLSSKRAVIVLAMLVGGSSGTLLLANAGVEENLIVAQTGRTVKGVVTDQNGEPLIGCNVVVVGSQEGVITAHPTNPVECCADANPKTMLPNDT